MLFGTMIDLATAENGSRATASSNDAPRSPPSRARVVVGWICCAIALAAVLLF
jgi:hypothetical protein